jgi:hypothetical protein
MFQVGTSTKGRRRKNVDQYSPANDKKLHTLAGTIGFARRLSERAGQMHDEAWEKVRGIFNEFPDKGKRFIADNGYYMQDQWKNGTTKWYFDILYEKMHEHFPVPEDLRREWNAITDPAPRVVNPTKLERRVRLGKIPQELVNQAYITGEGSWARIFQPWTKEDVNRAVVYGIQLQDMEATKEQQIKLLEEILAELRGTQEVSPAHDAV